MNKKGRKVNPDLYKIWPCIAILSAVDVNAHVSL